MYYLIRVSIGSISGYIPIVAMMALFHWRMRKQDKATQQKTATLHIVAVYLFCFALFSVLSVTDVPNLYNLEVDPVMNLVPFADLSTNFIEYVLNILLFVPIGFLLPMLWKKFEKFQLTLAYGFLFSLSVELLQLFNSRITDIDDLLMNTLGTIAGYLLFMGIKRLFPRISIFSIDAINHWKSEPYVCFGIAWLSMLLIQPLIGYLIQPLLTKWVWKSDPVFQ